MCFTFKKYDVFKNVTVLYILILCCQICVASPYVSKDHNFSIEFPVTWGILKKSLPSPALIAYQSTDGLNTIIVGATKLSQKDISTAMVDMIAGAKDSGTKKGWKIQSESKISLGGIPFHTFTSQISEEVSIVTYIGLAGDDGYFIQGIFNKSHADSDPDLIAVSNSFRLLSPRNIPIQSASHMTAYQVGEIIGQVLAIVLIIKGIIWLVRRSKPTNAQS